MIQKVSCNEVNLLRLHWTCYFYCTFFDHFRQTPPLVHRLCVLRLVGLVSGDFWDPSICQVSQAALQAQDAKIELLSNAAVQAECEDVTSLCSPPCHSCHSCGSYRSSPFSSHGPVLLTKPLGCAPSSGTLGLFLSLNESHRVSCKREVSESPRIHRSGSKCSKLDVTWLVPFWITNRVLSTPHIQIQLHVSYTVGIIFAYSLHQGLALGCRTACCQG